jgi:NAD(P)-dependent dehydrogenase (short-subunit alcohol dehydrogenase family)
MPKASDMKGKAALVTGAASGLGRATAYALAREGADICIVDLNAEGLQETAGAVRDLGVRAEVFATDVSKAENCRAAVAAAVAAFGRLDALCNVAGVLVLAHAHEMPVAEWDRVLAVNLSAPFHLSAAAIPHLLEQNGAVVNVSSCAAYIGEAYAAAYCATKAGLSHMTKALAMEYIHKPIRFNAVAPGGMITGMAMSMSLPPDADRSLIGRFSPLRGVCDVDEIAEMIAYLASPASSSVHGATFSMDKGIVAG